MTNKIRGWNLHLLGNAWWKKCGHETTSAFSVLIVILACLYCVCIVSVKVCVCEKMHVLVCLHFKKILMGFLQEGSITKGIKSRCKTAGCRIRHWIMKNKHSFYNHRDRWSFVNAIFSPVVCITFSSTIAASLYFTYTPQLNSETHLVLFLNVTRITHRVYAKYSSPLKHSTAAKWGSNLPPLNLFRNSKSTKRPFEKYTQVCFQCRLCLVV